MRKLILGIALVFVLDVAFIWMMALERQVPEMAQAVIPNAEAPMTREESPLESVAVVESEDIDDRYPASSASADHPSPKMSTSLAASRYRGSDANKVRSPSLDAKRLFPDKIIYYGKYETPEATDSSIDVSSASKPVEKDAKASSPIAEPRKRSFESRAFGVIKKPFNVIKKPFKWIGSVVMKVAH